VQIERGNGALGLGRFHPFDDHFGGSLGQRRENAAAVKPAHTVFEDRVPVKITGLELRSGLVAAIVKDDRGAHAVASIAVNSRDVRTIHTVMRESLEEAFYSHRAHTFGYQLTDGVVDHRRGDAGFKTKTVGEIGCDIKFTAAHVNVALMSFAKRDYTRIETMNQGSQRNKIERSVRGNVQTVVHIFAARSRCLEFAGSAGIPACITRAKYPQVSKVVLAESEAGRDACAPRLNLKQAGMP